MAQYRAVLGEFDLKTELTHERKNALMIATWGDVDPDSWITIDEDTGEINADKWARMWTALEYKMGMDMQLNILKMKAQ